MVATIETVQVEGGLKRCPFVSIELISLVTITELFEVRRRGGVAAEAVGARVPVQGRVAGGAQARVEGARAPRQRLADGGQVQHDDGDANARVRHRYSFPH